MGKDPYLTDLLQSINNKHMNNNDNLIGDSAMNGYLDEVKYYFDSGITEDGFRNAIANAARAGHVNIMEFLLDNSDDIYHHVALAMAWTSKNFRINNSPEMRSYLRKKEVDIKTNFTLRKKYEVV